MNIKTRLEKMTKTEILEALDTLSEATGSVDPESIYTDRDGIVDGRSGDELYARCLKYRQPLIDYIYRHLPPV